MRSAPRWSSGATPSRRGAVGAGSSTTTCEAPVVAVSFLQDSARTAVRDRQSLRWMEEGGGRALGSALGRCEDATERAVTGARCRGGNGQGGSGKRARVKRGGGRTASCNRTTRGRVGRTADGVRMGNGSRSAMTRARQPRVGSVAAQNRGGGSLPCGPHITVPLRKVKWRSIDLKINLN
jgi:hypothetical protein